MLYVDLNERNRVHLCLISCLVYFVCIGLSITLLAFTLDSSRSLDPFTELVEGYNAEWLWIVLLSASGLSILINVFGVSVCFQQMYPFERHHHVIKMALCTTMTILIAFALLACSVLVYLHVSHLESSFRGGLLRSMKRYRDNEQVKRQLDELQSTLKCCGDGRYTDWFQISWIADEFVDTANPDIRDRVYPGAGYKSDDVPFSCCNPSTRRPCIAVSVHENYRHFNYDFQKSLTLHTSGCRQNLIEWVSVVLMFKIGIVSAVLFVLELMVFVLARFIQTSVLRAIKSGQPTAQTRGYVVKFGFTKNAVDNTSSRAQSPLPTATSLGSPRSQMGRLAPSRYSSRGASRSASAQNLLPLSAHHPVASVSTQLLPVHQQQHDQHQLQHGHLVTRSLTASHNINANNQDVVRSSSYRGSTGEPPGNIGRAAVSSEHNASRSAGPSLSKVETWLAETEVHMARSQQQPH